MWRQANWPSLWPVPRPRMRLSPLCSSSSARNNVKTRAESMIGVASGATTRPPSFATSGLAIGLRREGRHTLACEQFEDAMETGQEQSWMDDCHRVVEEFNEVAVPAFRQEWGRDEELAMISMR